MKFICNLEGFTDNWIEFSDSWTRREGKELFELAERDAFNKFVPLKCIACHIEQVDGEPLTDPAKLSYDALDDVDLVVFGFMARALFSCYQELTRLGNASARLSSSTTAQMMIAALKNHQPS